MTTTDVLQRQILPIDRDTDVFALYVDPEPAVLDADKYEIGTNRNAVEMNAANLRQSISTGARIHPDQIESRTCLRVPAGERLSFGTYFNAFPASYWRRWTVVNDVTLTVKLVGRGASITVYKSMANGRSQRVDAAGDRAARSRAPSPSTSRSSRSWTAAGTGTTWWPATRTSSSSRPSGAPTCPPRTGPSTAPSTSRSRR